MPKKERTVHVELFGNNVFSASKTILLCSCHFKHEPFSSGLRQAILKYKFENCSKNVTRHLFE